MSELIEAAKAGDVARARQILTASPAAASAPNAAGETPVMAALYRGHHDLADEIADAIVAAGAPLDVFAAAALGRVEALDAALDQSGRRQRLRLRRLDAAAPRGLLRPA